MPMAAPKAVDIFPFDSIIMATKVDYHKCELYSNIQRFWLLITKPLWFIL